MIIACGGLTSLYIAASILVNTLPLTTTTNYEFGQLGSVQLQDPWTVSLPSPRRRVTSPTATIRSESFRTPTSSSSSPPSSPSSYYDYSHPVTLVNPIFLGSGGGGAVFSFEILTDHHQRHDDDDDDEIEEEEELHVAVKISWSKSAESVRNECNVLQTLHDRMTKTRTTDDPSSDGGGVPGTERCLGLLDYGPDPKRVMIFLQPVLPSSSVSSLSDLPTLTQQRVAVRSIIRTTVQMLVAGIVTTDVQPLISPETGRTVLIDMTEAKILTQPMSSANTSKRLQQQDIALINAFCTEIATLIPESLSDYASTEFLDELIRLEKKGMLNIHTDTSGSSDIENGGLLIDSGVQLALKSLPFVSDDLIMFLDELAGRQI
jgi:hypothetical protein